MSGGPGTERGDEPQQEVILIDEEGEERRFRLHDAFDADGQAYYLVEAVEDREQVLLLKETSQGLETVESDELDRVLALLEAEE